MAGPWDEFRTGGGLTAAPVAGPWADYQPPPAAPSVSQQVGDVARRLGMGTRDVIEGATELPGQLMDAASYPSRLVRRAFGQEAPSFSEGTAARMNATGLAAPATDNEKLISSVGRAGGGLLTTMGAGAGLQAAGRAPALADALLQGPGTQLASAAGGAAAGEVAAQNDVGPGGQLLATVAGGLAAPAALAAGRRVLSPVRGDISPEHRRLIQAAQGEGIPLSAGQETGSKPLRTMESVFGELPMTASHQARLDETQRVAFNRAALRYSGTEADRATPDVLNAARERIGGQIGAIANRNTLQVTPELEAGLGRVEDGLRFLPAEAAGPVRARVEQLRGMMIEPPAPGDAATIPGTAYRQLDSAIGRNMRGTTNGDLRTALGDLRGTLREAMDASISPQDATDWQQARRHYANLMNVANAMKPGAAGADLGHISPSALTHALNQSTGRGYAFGQGDMNDLARVGTSFVKPSTPNSGTNQRTIMADLLRGGMGGGGIGFATGGDPVTGALLGAGALATPRAVQAAYNTAPVRGWLTNQVGQPGHTRINNPGLVAALLAGRQSQQQ